MKIYSLIALVFIVASRSDACGISYPLPLGALHPNDGAFSPDGSFLVTANGDQAGPNTLVLFKIDGQALDGGTVYPLSSDSFPRSVAFSPSGDYCAVANSGLNTVTLFSVTAQGLSEMASYALPAGSRNPYSLAFSPNGSYVVTANHDSSDVSLFNFSQGVLSDGTSYALPHGSSGPYSIVFSPNGSLLAVAANESVALFTVSSGKLTKGTTYSLPAGSSGACSVAFSPDGDFLATANWHSNDVTLFSAEFHSLYGPVSYQLPPGSLGPKAVAFSPDGYRLAIPNNASNDVTLFAVDSGSSDGLIFGDSYALPTASSSPNSLAFSPKGSYFAVINDGDFSYNDSVAILNTYGACSVKSTTCHVGCILGLVAGGIVFLATVVYGALHAPRCYHAMKQSCCNEGYVPIN